MQADWVKVEKSKRRMHLFKDGEVLRSYRVRLGKNPKGHKTREGDFKTPEGDYVLDYVKNDSSFYRSMHVSYPNENDILKAKEMGVDPGGFIMVHGQKNGWAFLTFLTQFRDWTEGCIAITNGEMDEFIKLVPVGTTISIEW